MNAPAVRVATTLRKRARVRARALRMPLMPALQRRRLQCYVALMLADLAALFVGFGAAGYAVMQYRGLTEAFTLVQLMLPVFFTVALYNGGYSTVALIRAEWSVSRALTALLVAAGIVVFLTFYAKTTQELSRLEFSITVPIAGMVLALERLQMRRFIRWRCGSSVLNELVIDDGGPEVDLPGAYHVSARSFDLVPDLDDPHAMDRIGMALRNADRVIVSTPPERRAEWAVILKGASVSGEVIDETVSRLSAMGARQVNGMGVLQVSVGPLGLRARLVKRALDLVVAGSALLVLALPLLVIALLIKLEDGGPVFFIQRRVGQGNRFFSIYKFRSMRVNGAGRDGTVSASRDDARITRIGRFIRATSIDELPQLLNVVLGDMSLVGPRPHAIGSQAGDKLFWEVDTRYWERHALKPGLTGLAQIRGLRGATECEADLSHRLNADLEYLRGWSLWRDLRIIVLTFGVLVHNRAF